MTIFNSLDSAKEFYHKVYLIFPYAAISTKEVRSLDTLFSTFETSFSFKIERLVVPVLITDVYINVIGGNNIT